MKAVFADQPLALLCLLWIRLPAEAELEGEPYPVGVPGAGLLFEPFLQQPGYLEGKRAVEEVQCLDRDLFEMTWLASGQSKAPNTDSCSWRTLVM